MHSQLQKYQEILINSDVALNIFLYIFEPLDDSAAVRASLVLAGKAA